MYAIIEDSGSQLKVAEGDTIEVDLRNLPENTRTITFDKVLFLGGDKPTIGAPYVKGASVVAEILDADKKGEKIDVIKFKRRKGYRRKQGHRQRHMVVKVTSLKA